MTKAYPLIRNPPRGIRTILLKFSYLWVDAEKADLFSSDHASEIVPTETIISWAAKIIEPVNYRKVSHKMKKKNVAEFFKISTNQLRALRTTTNLLQDPTSEC